MKYFSYGSFISGIILGSVHNYPEAQIGCSLMIFSGLVGIIYDAFATHETIAFKEYSRIKNIQDERKKEKLSYESLVYLAEKSIEHKKNDRNDRNNQKNPMAKLASILIVESIKSKNPNFGLTSEQKLLNNYLEQVPIK